MRPLRILMLIYDKALTPTGATTSALIANGWSPVINEQFSQKPGALADTLDSALPHLVHMRGKPPLSALLHCRLRGLPVLLEHQASTRWQYRRALATIIVPSDKIEGPDEPDLHFLYLATLNIAFAPPVVRAQTRDDLTRVSH